jgi:hypothetical protein
MKKIHNLTITTMFFFVSSAHAGFIPSNLLDTDLDDQSTYAAQTVNLGAGTTVGDNVQGFKPITTGAGSVISGNVSGGTTVTTGALVSVAINDQLAFILGYVPPAPPPAVINQKAQFDAVQATLNQLGVTEGSTNLDIAFGISNETLTSGVYNSLNCLSMKADQTLTFDGEGVEGDFLFNIHNYLDFAAD